MEIVKSDTLDCEIVNIYRIVVSESKHMESNNRELKVNDGLPNQKNWDIWNEYTVNSRAGRFAISGYLGFCPNYIDIL